jgi:hypothetical protein
VTADDPFADLTNLRLTPEMAAAMERAAAAKQAEAQSKRKRSGEPFTKFPHSWEARLLQAKRISTYRVALHLLYLHWRTSGRPMALSNVAVAGKGVSGRSKWNALTELERLGLIKVERQNKKSPPIRLLVG